MTHYAKVKNNIVTDVVVVDHDLLHTIPKEPDEIWIETCPCSFEGRLIQYECSHTKPLRMNYAGCDYTYSQELDAFIPPKEHPSWMFDINTCTYIPRIPKPNDGHFWDWNETKLCWELYK